MTLDEQKDAIEELGSTFERLGEAMKETGRKLAQFFGFTDPLGLDAFEEDLAAIREEDPYDHFPKSVAGWREVFEGAEWRLTWTTTYGVVRHRKTLGATRVADDLSVIWIEREVVSTTGRDEVPERKKIFTGSDREAVEIAFVLSDLLDRKWIE